MTASVPLGASASLLARCSPALMASELSNSNSRSKARHVCTDGAKATGHVLLRVFEREEHAAMTDFMASTASPRLSKVLPWPGRAPTRTRSPGASSEQKAAAQAAWRTASAEQAPLSQNPRAATTVKRSVEGMVSWRERSLALRFSSDGRVRTASSKNLLVRAVFAIPPHACASNSQFDDGLSPRGRMLPPDGGGGTGRAGIR